MNQVITIADVHKRLHGLQSTKRLSDFYIIESANYMVANGRTADIKRIIEDATKSDSEIPSVIYLDLFEAFIDKANSLSEIESLCNYICSEGLVKCRDAKATQSLLKRRLSKIKKKLTGFTKKDRHKISYFSDSVIGMYDKMIAVTELYINCDRMIDNYNRISKRFNLEKLFEENTKFNGIEDTVVELCNRIDTYDLPDFVKFNTIIETAWYGFESRNINYDKNSVLKTAIDYFCFKENGIECCKQILNSTIFYDKNSDMKDIDILMEDEPEEDIVDNSIREHFSKYQVLTEENKNFSKLFKEFKKEDLANTEKPENKIKGLIEKLYSRNVEDIVEGSPNLLRWIRSFFIIGTATIPAIGPIVMIIGLIADRFISLHMERKDVKKMIICFKNEIQVSEEKLKSTDDPETKKRIEEYINSLKKAKNKINDYYSNLHTFDEEIDIDGDDIDDDLKALFGDDFDDIDDFLESGLFDKTVSSISKYFNLLENSTINDFDMIKLSEKLTDEEDLTNVAEIAARYPNEFHADTFITGMKNEIQNLKTGHPSSALTRGLRQSHLENAISITENGYIHNDNAISISSSYENINSFIEAYEAIYTIINIENNPDSLLEASFSNMLKMASMKLRNAFQKMSDKDKQISKSIDVNTNNMVKGIERALSNDNREAVIKGSILPSASKVVKLGITSAGMIGAGAIAGNPAMGAISAVITVLGYIGVSSKFRAKERQMVIDEIEIELKMCEKYISLAEQKNDMKALKELLQIQRNLTRQLQRVKYKMKMELGQKVYDVKSSNI